MMVIKKTALLTALLVSPLLAEALDPWEHNENHAESGEFDFNVYAVTWQPTFCEKQGDDYCKNQFYVHGIWPYFDNPDDGKIRNYHPSYCYNSPGCRGRTDCEITDEQAHSIMGLESLQAYYPRNLFLMKHEWHKHGTCSGLKPQEYFLQADIHGKKVFLP